MRNAVIELVQETPSERTQIDSLQNHPMPPILTLTINPALDKSCSVEQIIADPKLRCSEPACLPGGGGINVVRAIHNFGGDATASWTCGGVAVCFFRVFRGFRGSSPQFDSGKECSEN